MNVFELFLLRIYLFFKALSKTTWVRSNKASSSIVAAIIGIFVAMIIGSALIEPLAYDITTAVAGNLSAYTSAVSVANLIPLFFVMLLVAAAVAEVVRRL